MVDEPPIIVDNPFEFTNDGYIIPSFRDLGNVQDLGVAISAMVFERDYLKTCKTYIVGYSNSEVQILKQDCIYGGIRDLLITLDAAKLVYDLSFYIKPVHFNSLDINNIVKGFSQTSSNLPTLVKGWSLNNQINVGGYIRVGAESSAVLDTYIKTFLPSTVGLSNIIKGWSRSEFAFLFGIIKGYISDSVNLPEYLKANFSDTLDLYLKIFKIWHEDTASLSALVGGWQEANLIEYIHAFSYMNLPATLRSTYLYNLAASLLAITPVDLSLSLYGWATFDMPIAIAYARSPNDLAININGVKSVDLSVVINALYGLEIPMDLSVLVSSYYAANLHASIVSIPFVDLGAVLIPRCFSINLGAVIYPKIVYVRTNITLSYLECLDLTAALNPICFNSFYSDLSVGLYSMHSKNLTASVFGTDGSNITDLAVFINSFDYYEESSIKLTFFKPPVRYTSLTLSIGDAVNYSELSTFKLDINLRDKYSYKYLGVSIVGKPIEVNLGAFVRAYTPLSYEASDVKEKFITLKLNHSSMEEWHRYVELTFSSYVRSYYYFSGDQKAYREFIDDQWIVQVKGYSLVDLPNGIDRTKINRKYIFNLKRYTSIDAAIKDMTARVTELKNTDLSCEVVVEPKKEANLSILIASRSVYKSNRLLPVIINPV